MCLFYDELIINHLIDNILQNSAKAFGISSFPHRLKPVAIHKS